MKRIFLKISDTRLECQDEHPSLLAALESHNIDVEYQCREGYCGSCRLRLVSGQVDWRSEGRFRTPVSGRGGWPTRAAGVCPAGRDFALLLPGERRYRN